VSAKIVVFSGVYWEIKDFPAPEKIVNLELLLGEVWEGAGATVTDTCSRVFLGGNGVNPHNGGK